jgi:hypothetical protein
MRRDDLGFGMDLDWPGISTYGCFGLATYGLETACGVFRRKQRAGSLNEPDAAGGARRGNLKTGTLCPVIPPAVSYVR